MKKNGGVATIVTVVAAIGDVVQVELAIMFAREWVG
jgi:hypothetical protein